MIQQARVDGRKRRGAMTREITYQKVLLAVYMLSDDGGDCRADDRAIARECGHSIEAVRRSIAEMERRGVVWIFDWRMGIKRRNMALTDHPNNLPEPGDPVSRTAEELAALE